MADVETDPLLLKLQKMGDFGNFQVLVYALAWFAAYICAPVYVDSSFLNRRVDYRCYVPHCDGESSTYISPHTNFSIPHDADGKMDQCRYFVNIDTTSKTECDASSYESASSESCESWIYDDSTFISTTVTEFDLTCSRSWLAPVAGSMLMAGMLVGAITIGDLADRFGRKTGLLISVFLLGFGGLLSAISTNYIMFLAMRFLSGAGGVGLFQVSFVLAIEYIGERWRTLCMIMIQTPFALGEATVGVTAYFIREWRWLQLALTTPAFILLSYFWIMPESVRWLVSKGRRDEAEKIVASVAKMNKAEKETNLVGNEEAMITIVKTAVCVSSKEKLLCGEDASDTESLTEKPPTKTVFDLLRTPNLRKRTLNLYFCWIVCTVVYYGLSLNSGNLGGNLFVNFILTMLIEIPSYIFAYLALTRLGRKGTLSFVLLLGGIACFVSGLISEEYGWVIVSFSLLGKFGISAAFAVVFIYSAELFPTEYRSVGVGSCSMFARVGGICAPHVASLSHIYKPLPLLVFGCISILAGCLIVLMPETMGCELPQTLQESEDFGIDQPIWFFHCCGSKRSNSEETIESNDDEEV